MYLDDFFEKCTNASKVKQEIVVNYFVTWASIMQYVVKGDIAYIDLFSGPGKYENGTESTPLLILKKILENPIFCKRIHTIFNDVNPDYANMLDANIKSLPEYEKLTHKPLVNNFEVSSDIVEYFNSIHIIPSFIFIDPCGYKGFSLDLVWSVVKDFGCDCVAFFNYNRYNMHIANDIISREKLDAVLNCDTSQLCDITKAMLPDEREQLIIETVKQVANLKGIHFILEFRFKSEKNRTSHFLLFFSKSFLGYDKMKDVMYKCSKKDEESIALFQFDYNQDEHEQLTILFDELSSIEELKKSLLKKYSGKTIQFKKLYEEHSVGRRFVFVNYQKALIELYENNIIKTDRPPRKGSFSEKLVLTFPKE